MDGNWGRGDSGHASQTFVLSRSEPGTLTQLHPLPTSWGVDAKDHEYCDVTSINQLHPTTPASWGIDVEDYCDDEGHVISFRFSTGYSLGKGESAAIPTEIGNIKYLQRIQFVDNDLTGPIPSQLGKLTSLSHLFMTQNGLTGTLPSQFDAENTKAALNFRHQYISVLPPKLRIPQ